MNFFQCENFPIYGTNPKQGRTIVLKDNTALSQLEETRSALIELADGRHCVSDNLSVYVDEYGEIAIRVKN